MTISDVDLQQMLLDNHFLRETDVCRALGVQTREERELAKYQAKLEGFTSCKEFADEWRYRGSKHFGPADGFKMWLEVATLPNELRLFVDLLPDGHPAQSAALQKLLKVCMPDIQTADSLNKYMEAVKEIPDRFLENCPELHVHKRRILRIELMFVERISEVRAIAEKIDHPALYVAVFQCWLKLCKKLKEYEELYLEVRNRIAILQSSSDRVCIIAREGLEIFCKKVLIQLTSTLLKTLKRTKSASGVWKVLSMNYGDSHAVDQTGAQQLDKLLKPDYDAIETIADAQAVDGWLHQGCTLYVPNVRKWYELVKACDNPTRGLYYNLVRATLHKEWQRYTKAWQKISKCAHDGAGELEFILSQLPQDHADLLREIVWSFEDVNGRYLEMMSGSKKHLKDYLESSLRVTPNLCSRHWEEGVRRLATQYSAESSCA